MTTEGKDPTKKHRHDVGAIDHEPQTSLGTTRGLQVILGGCILFTAVLLVYAGVVAGGGAP